MFRWVTDVSRGHWVRDRLGPFGGEVSSVMPRGFEAYARVLHRAVDRGVVPVRWADVAASTGTFLHPAAQWWRVARRPDVWTQQPTVAFDEPWPDDWYPEGHVGTRRGGPREWPGGNPAQGELDHVQLPALVDVLRPFTLPDSVTAAFWEGSGWQGAVLLTLWSDDETNGHVHNGRTVPHLDAAVVNGPTLELPGRNHILFACTLDDVAALAEGTATADVTPFEAGSRTPSLLWPGDHAWCLATEVDFDSTLVGGCRALVDAVLADETLEAFEVAETDSLAYDADQVN